jgi:hypothetical protein
MNSVILTNFKPAGGPSEENQGQFVERVATWASRIKNCHREADHSVISNTQDFISPILYSLFP